MTQAPSYDSRGLVNLMAEIESRLIGSAPAPRLTPELSETIPGAETVVLILFDGLGEAQLAHPGAASFRESRRGVIEAGFPTTTSVSLATIATALPPSQHGVVAHLAWLPEHDRVVNTLKWVDLGGNPVLHEYEAMLPSPNLWERLGSAGVEAITVQPDGFRTSPLTRVLYRGARFEGIWDVEDMIDATVQLAQRPGRFIFTYVPQVDFAGHVFGLESDEFAEAMGIAARIWDEVRRKLPEGAVLIGTADHGLIEFPEDRKLLIREPQFDKLRFAGDTRGVHLWCSPEQADALVTLTGGALLDPKELIGPDPTSSALERLGNTLLIPPGNLALLPKGFDKRLRAYHGGLDRREVEIPLLVG
ncbi:MAG: hypothetical protein DWQ40_10740 [Actinobacteria bacterium]|nr:MAG: hypothetical protein DWQ40_10740 [Actinomycetota bacterium]REK33462.1 MAG: hypothetical protein DWQ20_07640 [Actinomycetota bacterium]